MEDITAYIICANCGSNEFICINIPGIHEADDAFCPTLECKKCDQLTHLPIEK